MRQTDAIQASASRLLQQWHAVSRLATLSQRHTETYSVKSFEIQVYSRSRSIINKPSTYLIFLTRWIFLRLQAASSEHIALEAASHQHDSYQKRAQQISAGAGAGAAKFHHGVQIHNVSVSQCRLNLCMHRCLFVVLGWIRIPMAHPFSNWLRKSSPCSKHMHRLALPAVDVLACATSLLNRNKM